MSEFSSGILRRHNPNESHPIEVQIEDRLATVGDVVEAHKTSGDFAKIQALHPEWRPEPIIQTALAKMKTLERAAEDGERWSRISENDAARIKRIIVFSAPGTYTRPVKNDPFRDKPWAWGMDRFRSDHAARLGIILAGKLTSQDFSMFDSREPLDANDPKLRGLQERTKQAIRGSGIRFAYVADEAGAKDMHLAMRQYNTFIPAENVDIINAVHETNRKDPEIRNTLDQAKATRDYLENLNKGDSVVFVAHGPQLVRMEGLLKHQHSIPEGIDVLFEPLAIPDRENTLMEAKGDLFNRGIGTSSGALDYSIVGMGRS